MRIGEFEITDHGNGFRMEYVGPKRYLTTASPDDNWWFDKLRASIGERKLWAKWIYEEPPLVNIEEDHDWWRGGICRPGDPKHIAQIIDEVNKAKKEKETAMEKDIRDYIGCYVKDISFDPPYTTIVWEDDTSTSVFCKDEPYDSEKGFAMAVLKKLFGDEYYKCMKEELTDHGAYEKDAKKVRYRIKKLTEEYEKLKKENEELSHSRLASENHTLTALNKDLADRNYKLEQKNEELKKELEWVIGMKNDLIAERDRLRQENYCIYDVDMTMRAIDTQIGEENKKLKKENDRLLTEVNTLDAVRYGIVKANEELKKDLDKIRKMNRRVIFENKMLDDANIALKSAVESLKKNNAAYKKENEDLKKAKENMAKKLAETKQLKKDLDAQMLNNGELDRENQKLRRDAEIKSDIIGMQREDIHRLKEWFRREAEKVKRSHMRIHELEAENEKYKDIVDMQKRYDELKEQYDLLTECHKRQAFTIGKQREEVEKLNKIKEILK